MKTFMATPKTAVREWWLVDANDKVLGRLAAQLATILLGKDKPTYTPHLDMGDFVVVVNAEKIKLTGKKTRQKVYTRYTGYPGGLRIRPFAEMLEKKPEEVIRLAVKRMLPRNKLRPHLLRKLKVYRGAEHPHVAQNPKSRQISA